MEKIVNAIKKQETFTSHSKLLTNMDEFEQIQCGTLYKYSQPFSIIIARKMDQLLLRNLAIKCRGFLQRQSLKYKNKWQTCFYQLDMVEFTSSKTRKVLNAFVQK